MGDRHHLTEDTCNAAAEQLQATGEPQLPEIQRVWGSHHRQYGGNILNAGWCWTTQVAGVPEVEQGCVQPKAVGHD